MHWFRSRARLGGWLALVALSLQLVLTFGHVHPGDPAPLTQNRAAVAVDASAQAPAAPDAPDGLADGYCAVCALIHLANSLTAIDAPAVALPIAFERVAFVPAVSIPMTASRFTPLQARAPPVA